MTNRALQLLTVLAMLMPALSAATIRLIERNGDAPPVERVIAAMSVPRNGVVVIVPDVLFSGGFER